MSHCRWNQKKNFPTVYNTMLSRQYFYLPSFRKPHRMTDSAYNHHQTNNIRACKMYMFSDLLCTPHLRPLHTKSGPPQSISFAFCPPLIIRQTITPAAVLFITWNSLVTSLRIWGSVARPVCLRIISGGITATG